MSGALLLSLGTMTSRILGLIRDMVMAALFDRTITDAWTVAFRLPNLFRRLFGEGSLALSFIPVFVDLREQDPRGVRARNLVNAFYTCLLIFLGVLCALGMFFAEPILQALLDPVYLRNIEKYVLTVQMARIMFGFVFFIVSYAYFMAILQALGEFKWPAFAPVLFNVSMISFTLMPVSWFSMPGEGLAWGVLVGGILQALVLIPILQRKNYFPGLHWRGMTEDLKKLFSRMLPAILALGLLQLMTIINLHFASRLGEGVISAIYWADRLLELPLSLVSVSLSAAILPLLSEHWSRQEKNKLRDLQREQLVISGVWMVPASFGLFFLAKPIVEVLFYRGQFSLADLEQTSLVVQLYALSLIALSGSRLLLNALAAAHDVKGAGSLSILALVLHFFLAPYLMIQHGLKGLMISTLIVNSLQFVLLAVLFHFKIGSLSWGRLLRKYLQLMMFSVGIAVSPFLFHFSREQGLPAFLGLGLCLIFGAGSYFALGRLFKAHPLFSILG